VKTKKRLNGVAVGDGMLVLALELERALGLGCERALVCERGLVLV